MTAQWKCEKCGRSFGKEGQAHSCKIYPLENHFDNKPYGKTLFLELIQRLKTIGNVRVDSVECCIHLVSNFTFSGVWILKDKIRVSFQLDHKVKSSRFQRYLQMSLHRHLYHVEIREKKDIDTELVGWLKESYHLKKTEH